MSRRAFILAALLIAVVIFTSGCTSQSPSSGATPTQATVESTITTPEPTYAVTEPILVKGDDIYSIKISTDAKKTESNTLYVSVNYDSSTNLASTGVGSELMATLFAYNYNDVPYDFNPRTTDDVINAGIPYKKVQKVVYPNNDVTAGTELPTESVQGGLNLANPYNYGVIVEKTGTRN